MSCLYGQGRPRCGHWQQAFNPRTDEEGRAEYATAGRVVGKKSLELWERLWEPKIATLVNVHEHGRTLPLVAVGDNRIGKIVFKTARGAEQGRFWLVWLLMLRGLLLAVQAT